MYEKLQTQYSAQIKNGNYETVPFEITNWCQEKINNRQTISSRAIQCFGAVESRNDQQNIGYYKDYLKECLDNSLRFQINNESIILYVCGSATDKPEVIETCQYLQKIVDSYGVLCADSILVVPAGRPCQDAYLENIKIPNSLSNQIGRSLNPPQQIPLKFYYTDKYRKIKTQLIQISEGVNPLLAVGVNRKETPKNPNNSVFK